MEKNSIVLMKADRMGCVKVEENGGRWDKL
jgi:hypothetical protein